MKSFHMTSMGNSSRGCALVLLAVMTSACHRTPATVQKTNRISGYVQPHGHEYVPPQFGKRARAIRLSEELRERFHRNVMFFKREPLDTGVAKTRAGRNVPLTPEELAHDAQVRAAHPELFSPSNPVTASKAATE